MTVEIREIVIKTDIVTQPARSGTQLDTYQVAALKQRVIDECLKFLSADRQRDGYNR